MKNEHVGFLIVAGFVGIALLIWRTTGAATNCSFFDTIMGKCGAS